MLKNYFKIAFRNLWKNKAFSIINIVGLAVGMAACITIMLFVFYEKSFDNFHTKNIYRLNEVQKPEGMVSSQKVALSMYPMANTLKNEFPEIKSFTRVSWRNKYQITYENQRLFLPQAFFVDSTFLQIFDFQLAQGDRNSALQKPNSAVITEQTAVKLFGKENPIGKRLTHYADDTLGFVVTAVLKNIPQNSQLQFDALFSFSTIYNPQMAQNWGGNWLNTYLELAPNTDAKALEKKFPGYLKKYMAQNEGWKGYELFLLPLRKVHAGAADIGLDYINYQKFDSKYTNIFFVIALLVLLIASINFMNLSTARSAERAREVGVRKVIGAQRWQLSLQFLSESIILSLMALVLAVLLVELSLPYINDLSQRELHLPLLSKPLFLLGILGGAILLGLISGLYPAAYLSSFLPIRVLKGSTHTGRNKSLLRNILVVSQFSSAIFLIIITVFAVRQLNYMQTADTGFNRDQVINIPLDGMTYKKYDVIKADLLNSALIAGVTGALDELGNHLDQSGVTFKGNGPERQLVSTRLIVDNDYLKTYQIQVAIGRDFSPEASANSKEYIINEALAKELLKDDPKASPSSLLGRTFGFDSLGTIVGIAKNFNFNSLHYKIETMFMYNQKDWGFSNMSVKLNGGKTREALAFMESVWRKNVPDREFEYHFLDDHFEEVYRADAQVSQIVAILAGLAIFISCLGLFGLASYSAEKRVKEVGIRKVLGASVQHIATMLSKDFLKYVLISAIIAWPLAWICIHQLLKDYAYRIPVNLWIFVWASLLALLIALVTISFQAIRAAIANPIISLRSE